MLFRERILTLYTKHILHSLGIAKVIDFVPGTVLDVGTGGGFPGIPLAILFRKRVSLIDIIAKKIKVVQAVVDVLELKNVKTEQLRAELVGDFDFIVSRAVTNMPDFVSWIKTKSKESKHELQNGILYLKGGFNRRIKRFPKATQYDLADFFEDEF
jgi:16S rRNA (guanine527-N7)-methyltransferase